MESLKYLFLLSLLTVNLNSAALEQDQIDSLIDAAKDARKNSYSPYSKFKVGAAILTKSGRNIRGTNVENAAYGPTNCAERTAIFTAVTEGEIVVDKDGLREEKRMQAIAVVLDVETPEDASPCGVCRQVIWEFAEDKDMPVIMCTAKGEYVIKTIGELLPFGFKL